ncbi:MAG: hypothetical protein GDA54_06805 [Alphaproteobacteria bacterium GM7ARS4]|nr:hypothetical protein [Alphaproteobacteria bacterium GM7ARS4]
MTIISFTLQLIFIKNVKVAGSSFEAALSSFCGDGDFWPSVSLPYFEGEVTDDVIGWCYYPFSRQRIDEQKLVYLGQHQPLHTRVLPHSFAKVIMEAVGQRVFSQFLKVAMIRNPFERVVSDYAWVSRNKVANGHALSVDDFRQWFLTHGSRGTRRDSARCCIETAYDAIDVWLRYEHREQDMACLSERLGLKENVYDAFKGKTGKRNIRPPWLTAHACFDGFRDGIERLRRDYAIELTTFGYDVP